MSVTFYDPKNPVQYDEDYNVTGGCPELNVSNSNARDILLVLGLCDIDGELYGEISAKDLSVLVRRTIIRLNNTSNTTNESINRIHEEFLRYNGIDPEDVTMEVAEKLVNERKEPKMSVSITRYTFLADIRGQVSVFDVLPVITQDAGNPLGAIAPSFLKPPWYHCKQSCVSFCYHMIENADPDPQSIETKLFDFVTLQSFDNFTVPWFENFIKKHWGKEIRKPPKNIVHDIGRAVSDAILDNPVVNNSVTRTGRYWLWDRWTSN